MGVVPLTIISSDPLATFLPPVSATLCSAGLKFLAPEGGMIPPGDTTMVPLNCKLRLLPSHCGIDQAPPFHDTVGKEERVHYLPFERSNTPWAHYRGLALWP